MLTISGCSWAFLADLLKNIANPLRSSPKIVCSCLWQGAAAAAVGAAPEGTRRRSRESPFTVGRWLWALVGNANFICILAGCGLLRTRWLANPLTGLAPPQNVPHKVSPLHPGPYGESLDFLSFSKIISPPWGGVNTKKEF